MQQSSFAEIISWCKNASAKQHSSLKLKKKSRKKIRKLPFMFSLIATFQQQHHTTQSTTWEKTARHTISLRSCFTANCNSLSQTKRESTKRRSKMCWFENLRKLNTNMSWKKLYSWVEEELVETFCARRKNAKIVTKKLLENSSQCNWAHQKTRR